METTISVAELERGLADVLDRVRDRGERFAVERDGQRVATIVPAAAKPAMTWAGFVAHLRDAPRPDDAFADDLEAIQASQGQFEVPEWPD